MYAEKYWNKDCISWKRFYWQCKKFLDNKAMDCSQEEFEEYHPCKVNTYDFMESQEMVLPQDADKIEAKCDEVYGEAYSDTLEECREAWGWE